MMRSSHVSTAPVGQQTFHFYSIMYCTQAICFLMRALIPHGLCAVSNSIDAEDAQSGFKQRKLCPVYQSKMQINLAWGLY